MANEESDFDDYEDIDIFGGLILEKRFVLIDQIGAGVNAVVWLSYDFVGKKYYAIKIQNHDYYEAAKEEVVLLKKISAQKTPELIELKSYFVYVVSDAENGTRKYMCMVFQLMAGSLLDLI